MVDYLNFFLEKYRSFMIPGL